MIPRMRSRAHVCYLRSAGRQRGGETLEFAIFAGLFFLLVFAIVDMSIVMFNQGVTNAAARYGARQGTLYWVDPTDYDPAYPRENIRVKERMIDSAVDFFSDNILLNFAGIKFTKAIELPEAAEPTGTTGNRVWTDVSDALVNVQLDYPQDFIVIGQLAGLAGFTMDAGTRLDTESDL